MDSHSSLGSVSSSPLYTGLTIALTPHVDNVPMDCAAYAEILRRSVPCYLSPLSLELLEHPSVHQGGVAGHSLRLVPGHLSTAIATLHLPSST